MYSLLQSYQLDLNDLSGYLAQKFITGDILRSGDTGIFLTNAYLNNSSNIINSYLVNSSGTLVATGNFLLGELISGTFPTNLLNTGITLIQRDDTISGIFNQSGQNIINYITGLSGAFNQTGYSLLTLITGESGSFNQTGLNLRNLLTGESGTFNHTGLNLRNILTGQSGAFNISGLNIFKTQTGLSGAFNQTGSNLIRLITGESGAFNISGYSLYSETKQLTTGNLRLQGLSGVLTITGAGALVVSNVGNDISLSINEPEAEGRIRDVNNLTGNVFVTGSGDITTVNQETGFYISGGDFVPKTGSGIFGPVSTSGEFLLSNDINWSGQIITDLNVQKTGVLTLNGLFGDITLTGGGSVINELNSQDIILSGQEIVDVPNWVQSSPDIFSITNNIDDDFNSPILNDKWTVINDNTSIEYSGISNSHLFFAGDATSTSLQPANSFVQNVTTGTEWEIIAKFNFHSRLTNRNTCGLTIRNSGANIEKWYSYYYNTSINPSETITIFSHTGGESLANWIVDSNSGYDFGDYRNVYFRVRYRQPGNFLFDVSLDNILWRNFFVESYPILSDINQVGFFAEPRGTTLEMAVDWFRATGLS